MSADGDFPCPNCTRIFTTHAAMCGHKRTCKPGNPFLGPGLAKQEKFPARDAHRAPPRERRAPGRVSPPSKLGIVTSAAEQPAAPFAETAAREEAIEEASPGDEAAAPEDAYEPSVLESALAPCHPAEAQAVPVNHSTSMLQPLRHGWE